MTITKKDIAVTLACVLLVALNLGALGNAARERAKRAVCLANLGRLMAAWHAFADDNDGHIVNGSAGHDRPGEIAWIQRCWPWYYGDPLGRPVPEEDQKAAIRAGALWLYCSEITLYRCPAGMKNEFVNYSIVDSMNGFPQPEDTRGRGDVSDQIVKNRAQIQDPSKRLVFIDQGWATPDSFAVHSDMGRWWDDPPLSHHGGTTVSFADGRAEYWKWSAETVKSAGASGYHGGILPQTREAWMDLLRVQKSVWPRLNYTPPYPPPF